MEISMFSRGSVMLVGAQTEACVRVAVSLFNIWAVCRVLTQIFTVIKVVQ